MTNRKRAARLKHFTPEPEPASLGMAFAEIEQLDARHAESRGTNYAAIRQHEGRCLSSRMPRPER